MLLLSLLLWLMLLFFSLVGCDVADSVVDAVEFEMFVVFGDTVVAGVVLVVVDDVDVSDAVDVVLDVAVHVVVVFDIVLVLVVLASAMDIIIATVVVHVVVGCC